MQIYWGGRRNCVVWRKCTVRRCRRGRRCSWGMLIWIPEVFPCVHVTIPAVHLTLVFVNLWSDKRKSAAGGRRKCFAKGRWKSRCGASVKRTTGWATSWTYVPPGVDCQPCATTQWHANGCFLLQRDREMRMNAGGPLGMGGKCFSCCLQSNFTKNLNLHDVKMQTCCERASRHLLSKQIHGVLLPHPNSILSS